MKLILAQGNPEKQYETTRHNIGWLVLDAYAKHLGATWKHDKKHVADIATAAVNGEKVLLVKPHTYYNETGRTAQSLVQFFKLIPHTDVLVLHDDLALPFGTIRTREKGSDAGNNGIKSLNAHLGPDYARIRLGVWNDLKQHMGDADFVLASFSKAEQGQITDTITPATLPLIDAFIHNSLEPQSIQSLRL
ncbi:aminoacyl-tRNA hydrolase [Candidatus Saccharibacteria bacterium TM7i]|nr:aminoacyl-tRNA hydrolase [Candidatus Saccharibacteria bacterium TM7i]